MRRLEDNPYLIWFKLASWLLTIAALGFAAVAVISPHRLLAFIDPTSPRDVLWVRFAGMVVFFLGLACAGAARNPFRYRLNACLAVLVTVAFSVFWLWAGLYTESSPSLVRMGLVGAGLAIFAVVTYQLMMRHEYLNPEISE